MSRHSLRLLGAPAFEGDGAQRFAPERVFQVIAYLAYKGEWVQRGVLAALFYGDHPEEAARRNLRKLLLRARGFAWFAATFEATRDSVRLQLGTDVQALCAAAREQRPETVLQLYRGRLLEGLDAPECQGYSEWLQAERERLQALWRDAVLELVAQSSSSRHAIELSQRLIDADPLDEAAWRAHLAALSADGQTVQAQRAYRSYAARLAQELGVEPTAELRAFGEASVEAGTPVRTSFGAAVARGDDGFIGRVAELQQIAALIAQDDCRLLTLVGPGGVGKSSLARRALMALDAAQVGRTAFVALEDVATPAEIGARIARALEIPLAGNAEPLQQVTSALGGTRALLLLDNFEHLVAGASALVQLLDLCPLLKLIVTSRARLAIAREWLLPVEGLPYPTPEDDDRAEAFDAVRLFIRAARRVKPGFAVATERAAIVTICRQVDGLPLALEIAAAWTRLLSCAAIVAELERGTELLRIADSARPARQASIAAVFEHSWRLLSPLERAALARLSVFRTAVTRATARAVTGASLPVLAALADKSLLQMGAGDRCSLHPLVHHFAGARLQEDEAAPEVAQRHAEFYCRILEHYAAMESVAQREALERIAPELSDATAALAWAQAHERRDLIGPAALVLAQIFDLTGRPHEGLAVLGPPPQLPAATTRAQARSFGQLAIGHATLYHRLAQYPAAGASAEQALRAYRSAGDGEGMRMALSILSTTSIKVGRHAESRRYCLAGLRSAERADDRVGIGTFLNNLGQVESELGEWDAAIEHYERALVVNKAVDNQVGIIAQLNNLARAHIGAGRHERARTLLFEGLRRVDEAGFGAMRSYFLNNLARTSLETGDLQAARRYADEGMAAAHAVADLANVPGLLLILGELALKAGQPEEAQMMVREAAQVTHDTRHRRWLVRCLTLQARVRHALGDTVGARRIAQAIEAAPDAGPAEIAEARALARELGLPADSPPERAGGKPPSLDELLIATIGVAVAS